MLLKQEFWEIINHSLCKFRFREYGGDGENSASPPHIKLVNILAPPNNLIQIETDQWVSPFYRDTHELVQLRQGLVLLHFFDFELIGDFRVHLDCLSIDQVYASEFEVVLIHSDLLISFFGSFVVFAHTKLKFLHSVLLSNLQDLVKERGEDALSPVSVRNVDRLNPPSFLIFESYEGRPTDFVFIKRVHVKEIVSFLRVWVEVKNCLSDNFPVTLKALCLFSIVTLEIDKLVKHNIEVHLLGTFHIIHSSPVCLKGLNIIILNYLFIYRRWKLFPIYCTKIMKCYKITGQSPIQYTCFGRVRVIVVSVLFPPAQLRWGAQRPISVRSSGTGTSWMCACILLQNLVLSKGC